MIFRHSIQLGSYRSRRPPLLYLYDTILHLCDTYTCAISFLKFMCFYYTCTNSTITLLWLEISCTLPILQLIYDLYHTYFAKLITDKFVSAAISPCSHTYNSPNPTYKSLKYKSAISVTRDGRSYNVMPVI